VTGAALVFRIELQRTWYPHLFTSSAPGVLVDPAIVMDRVQRAYPAGRLVGVDVPTTARPTYLAYVTSGPRFLTVLIESAIIGLQFEPYTYATMLVDEGLKAINAIASATAIDRLFPASPPSSLLDGPPDRDEFRVHVRTRIRLLG
jgi:hypothetical protein